MHEMHEHLLQVVDQVDLKGSVVKDVITDQEFFIPGLFLDKENEDGELLLFELPKSKLEVVK